MPTTPINGIDLYYELQGSGPPLALVHGGGSTHLTWWQQVHDLMKDYTIITLDQRGFGFSGPCETEPAAYVDDLRGLLDHLGIKRAALLGQSIGGYTSAGFASRYPERVTALILTSGNGGLLPIPQDGHTQQAFAAATAAKSNADFLSATRHSDGFADRDPKGAFLFEMIGILNFRLNMQKMIEAVNQRFDLTPIANARIPTLLLAGDEDSKNCTSMKELAALIPGARFQSMANCGHHLFFEKPGEFNMLIREIGRAHV